MGTGGDGGRYGGHLASVWESLKKRKTRTAFCIFFFIKINLGFSFFFFFSFSPTLTRWLLESVYTVLIFNYKCWGCAKKKKKFMFLVQSADRDCYSCDVISNFPPANWLTKQECGLKDKESRNRDIKLDFFTKQGPQKYTQLLQVSCSLTQISTVFSAL